jgi:nucleoid-associated protein YgaU
MMDMSNALKALLPVLLLAVLLTGCGSRIVPLVPEETPAVTWEVPPAPTPTPLLSPPPEAVPTATMKPEDSGIRLPAGQHYPPRLAENWEEDLAAETAALPDTYTVRRGDCLWTIAEALYGNGAAWRSLWAANRETVENPSLVFVDQVLDLPAHAG